MRVIRDLSACPEDAKGAVIALGNFDGVHLGHQAILRECLNLAKAEDRRAAVMTFEPHPREFFAKEPRALRLCSLRQKLALFADMGIEIVFLARFNKRFSSQSAQVFIDDVLHRALSAHHIITGHNFFFGAKRRGDCAMLLAASEAAGFGFTAMPSVHEANGAVISSSAIRALLEKGDVGAVAARLGRPYEIAGRVRRGEQRGGKIGFPTANIALDKLFRSRFGVYAARVTIGKENMRHEAIANLGIRPTFGASEPLLEAHVFAMNRSLYGECIRVELAGFIREEQRFANVEALKAQIAEDCRQVKKLLKTS